MAVHWQNRIDNHQSEKEKEKMEMSITHVQKNMCLQQERYVKLSFSQEKMDSNKSI